MQTKHTCGDSTVKTEWVQTERKRCLASLWALMIAVLMVNMLVQPLSVSAADGKRVAFVVGIGDYDNLPAHQQLKNALDDADGVSAKLKEMEFDLIVSGVNLKRSDFNAKWQNVLDSLSKDDTFVLFFSGHGVQIEGQNYLLPRDIPSPKVGRQTEFKRESISLNELLTDLTTGDRLHPKSSVVILDACRDDPLIPPGYKGLTGGGLAGQPQSDGIFIIYSAASNRVALDRLSSSDPVKYSVFTRVLLPLLGRQDLSIQELSLELKKEVGRLAKSANSEQRPDYFDGFDGNQRFCLPGCVAKDPGQARDAAVRDARITKSYELAAQALNERGGRLDRALLLSLAAFRVDSNVRTRRSILEVLQYPARRFTNLWGGLRAINDVAFSPDGKFLMAAGPDGELMRWTVSEPSTLGVRLPGHTGAVNHVTFAQEARLAASAGADNNVLLWDFTEDAPSRKVLSIKEPNLMRAVLSPDGRRLATLHHGKTITVRDVDSERTIASVTLTDFAEGPFYALAYSPNGRLLASGSGAGRVRIWNATDLTPYGDVLDLGLFLQTVAFDPSGSILAIGMGSGAIHLWEFSAGVQKLKPLQGHGADVTSLAFSADGKVLASASRDNTIRLWDISAGVALAGFEPLEHRGVTSVALDRSGRWLASGSSEGNLRLWDLSTRTGIGDVLPDGPNSAAALAISAGGNTLAVADLNGRLSLWNVPARTRLKSPLIKVHDSRAQLLYFTKDDQEIISTDRYSEICVIPFSLEKKSCRSIKELVSDGGAIFPSPDRNVLASRSKDGIVRLWNADSFKPMGKPFPERVHLGTELSFSSDSQILGAVCGTASTAMCLWTIGSTSTPLKVPVGLPGIADLSFKWDRKIVAAGGWDNLVWLWDLTSTPKRLEPLRGHIGPVLRVLFSPDGRILSSAAQRDHIRLWDMERSGIFDTALKGHQSTVISMVFSGDSKVLVSAGDDGLIVLWDLSETSWRERACRMANRSLTKEEWIDYVGDSKPFELLCPQ